VYFSGLRQSPWLTLMLYLYRQSYREWTCCSYYVAGWPACLFKCHHKGP